MNFTHRDTEYAGFIKSFYIYAFSRSFYPKRLTMHLGYNFFYQYVCDVRTNDEDVENLDEDVYCSIAVTKYMLYLGFNGAGMNPEHPKS